MDYQLIGGAGFILAIWVAAKVYDAITARINSKLLGWAGAVPAWLATFVVVSVHFAGFVLHNECRNSHDPSACVADATDTDSDGPDFTH